MNEERLVRGCWHGLGKDFLALVPLTFGTDSSGVCVCGGVPCIVGGLQYLILDTRSTHSPFPGVITKNVFRVSKGPLGGTVALVENHWEKLYGVILALW